MRIDFAIIICCVILSCCEAYKFLVAINLPTRSHTILGDGVVKHLLNDGHEVTYISPYPYKYGQNQNLREVDVSASIAAMPKEVTIESIMNSTFGRLDDYVMLSHVTLPFTALTLENPNVQALLTDVNENYDAVIVEWTYNELASGLAALYDCPLIWLAPIDVEWMLLDLIGHLSNPAYTTSITSTNKRKFTFIERIEELWTQIRVRFQKYMHLDKQENELYKKLIVPFIEKRGRTPPSYYDLQYNASLVISNTYTMGDFINVPLKYLPLAGYYIDDTVPPLPQALKKLLDNSSNGVIYFSMGTTLMGRGMPDAMKRELVKLFGSLKQTVIWKLEEVLTDLPANVHILNYAPQFSVLDHPNCRLFITHGGHLSTTEAIHFAVPIVGIPLFGDQFHNVNKFVERGIGKSVNLYSSNVVHNLKLAIEDIIASPSYMEKIKELSSLYHDRPVKPGAELVHWVKHVVRTRGAPHLRSSAALVPLYQKLYLDLLGLIGVLFIGIYKTLAIIYKRCSKTNLGSKKVN